MIIEQFTRRFNLFLDERDDENVEQEYDNLIRFFQEKCSDWHGEVIIEIGGWGNQYDVVRNGYVYWFNVHFTWVVDDPVYAKLSTQQTLREFIMEVW